MEIISLLKKYGIKVTGVIQIGCHFYEEESLFDSLGIDKRVLIEPLKDCNAIIKGKIAFKKDVKSFQVAISDIPGKLEMFVDIANEGQSSSLLKPKKHLEQYPGIEFPKKELVDVITLDSLPIDKFDYDFLYMDIQGNEKYALKGAFKTLKNINAIFTEVNRAELYEGCTLVEELDELLKPFGLIRVETDWIGNTWGDALYVRESLIVNEPKALMSGSTYRADGGEFNEMAYLLRYDDVYKAVKAGLFVDGKEHFDKHGRAEGRNGSK